MITTSLGFKKYQGTDPADLTTLNSDNMDLLDTKLTGAGGLSADILADGTTNKAYTAAEKTKLSGVSTQANKTALSSLNGNVLVDAAEVIVYTHPSGDGNHHVPATSTTNNLKVLKAGATAGSEAWGNVAFSELTGATGLSAAIIGDGSVSTMEYQYINSLRSNAQDQIDAKAGYNWIINGNFDVVQRGTSFTNPVNGLFTTDRYFLSFNVDGGTLPTTIIHSKLALTSGDINGAYNYYNINVNGAGSAFGVNANYVLNHKIENGTRLLCGTGKKIIVSFLAKSDIVGKRIGIDMIQRYGSGGSPSANEQLIGTIFTLTSTWTKYTFTFTTNTLVGKTFGTNNDDMLHFQFIYMWGTSVATSVFGGGSAESFVGSGNIGIAQVKVETGDTVTAFQPNDYSIEENRSLRFNRRIGGLAFMNFGSGQATSTTQATISIPLSVRTRLLTPTLTNAGNFRLQLNGASTVNVTGFTLDGGQTRQDQMVIAVSVASGLTAGQLVLLQANNDATAYLNFDAEL